MNKDTVGIMMADLYKRYPAVNYVVNVKVLRRYNGPIRCPLGHPMRKDIVVTIPHIRASWFQSGCLECGWVEFENSLN